MYHRMARLGSIPQLLSLSSLMYLDPHGCPLRWSYRRFRVQPRILLLLWALLERGTRQSTLLSMKVVVLAVRSLPLRLVLMGPSGITAPDLGPLRLVVLPLGAKFAAVLPSLLTGHLLRPLLSLSEILPLSWSRTRGRRRLFVLPSW